MGRSIPLVALRSCLACLALTFSGLALAGERLVLELMFSSGPQRSAWVSMVEHFAKLNPDLEVVSIERGQEEYKREFGKNLETTQSDIVFWFAGERLRQWARTGLLRPLEPQFVNNVLKPSMVESTLAATRIDGQVYGFPMKYYQWGFFYRKSVFKRLRINPPKTWQEFMAVCEVLQASGITPLAVGNRDGWPAAAWFDYLNLRLNGAEFHRALLRRDISVSDPRVRQVFQTWRQLLEKGYFLPDTLMESWDSVMPYIYRERVGMALLGGSIAVKLPEQLAQDIGYFPFPRMSSKIAPAEEAPLDIMVLPRQGQNPAAARRFLTYLATTEALNQFNDVLRTVSPRIRPSQHPDPFVQSAKQVLNNVASITFYFDRDAKADLIGPAFQAFKTFLSPPYSVDDALAIMNGASP